MGKKTSQFIDIEASESDYSDYSEDLGPSDPSNEVVVESKIVQEQEEDYPLQYHSTVEPRQSLLPSRSSPCLFLVRCKPRKEMQVANKLMTICKEINNKNQSSGILSVICKDDLRGYIYVESHSKSAVTSNLADVRFASRNRVSMVPLSEMTDIFTNSVPPLEPDSFARVRSGRYRGDVVKVIEVSGESIRVKVIPRIDGARKLFDPSLFNCTINRGYAIFKRDCYKDGFLEKEMLRSNLVSTTDVSYEDQEIFGVKRKSMQIGDKVLVTKGELKNKIGVVKGNVNGLIEIDTENIQDTQNRSLNTTNSDSFMFKKRHLFKVEQKSVCRHFSVGDFVSYNDENGVVVNVEGNEAVILINMDKECRVNVDLLSAPVFTAHSRLKIKERRRIRRDPLVGKEVVVQLGEFKGHHGVIQDIYMSDCRVLLNTNMKEINIARDGISVCEQSGFNSTEIGAFGYKTPIYRTPTYKNINKDTPGYKTPSYNRSTPGYKTPSYNRSTPGYKTPSYSKHTSGYKTPSYSKNTPGYKTPSYSKHTPGYKTPAYTELSSFYQKGQETQNEHIYSGIILLVGDKEAILRNKSGDIYYTDEGEYRREAIKFIQPAKYDKVCIMEGENEGKCGLLVDLTNQIGVVRTVEGVVVSVPVTCITKMIN